MTEKFDFYTVQRPREDSDGFTWTAIETICKTEEEALKYIKTEPCYPLRYKDEWVIVGGRFGEELELYFE